MCETLYGTIPYDMVIDAIQSFESRTMGKG